MTKAELVEDVARAAELTKKDAERLVEELINDDENGEQSSAGGAGAPPDAGAADGPEGGETTPLM